LMKDFALNKNLNLLKTIKTGKWGEKDKNV
jgi:hypothetical protein